MSGRVQVKTSGFSPMAMLVGDRRTNRLLDRLADQLDALRSATEQGASPPLLSIPKDEIAYCRDQWETGVLKGEHALYDLAALLVRRLSGSNRIQHVARVVVGPREEDESAGSARITIEEQLSRENLKRVTDYSLAHRIARHYQYRPRHDAPFGRLFARASFLEMRPLSMGEDASATRVLTRVKVNDQIWNKVCDALFEIDGLVQRNKILNRRSKYVKDVFGVKILTPRKADSYRVDAVLNNMVFAPEEFQTIGSHYADNRHSLELIEHKDYLSLPADKKKRTGWEAIKNVYRWGDQIFEVQIQTEANYFLEVLDLTDTSHRTFEMQRRRTRHELEERIPHYADFRKVLKYVFRNDPARPIVDPPDWLRITE